MSRVVGLDRTVHELVVQLLGPVQAAGGERRTAFAGAKQRAVVALLALDAGRVVAADRLVDAVWGERPPVGVRAALQVHVSQIRKHLADVGARGVLHTQAPGYVLDIGGEAVDVHRFERLAAGSRRKLAGGAHAESLALAQEALALWRGAPLGGVGDAPFAAAVATGMWDRRSELIEVAADADLAGPHSGQMLVALEQLVIDEPYRESAWSRLATTLYRSGRQADALSRLGSLRRLLREELGLDPGPPIVALETAILNHDPALQPMRGAAPAGVIKARSHLPALRPLVGRDGLINSLVDRLADNSPITLVGPGGVGKTSVAAHVAARSAPRFVDGVFFVELSAVDDGALVSALVGASIGMRAAGHDVATDDLLAVLDGLRVLICLDNCEHLVDDVAALVDALTSLTDVRVLSTSQVPLDVAGEAVVAVAPLPVDDAAELFVQRARAAAPNFNVNGDESVIIERICERVDRVPLGVELIAARMRSLTPTQAMTQLDDVSLLGVHRRGGPQRQRTLDATVRWSYELLEPPSQAVLRRLSVFDGSAELDDVVTVAADDASGHVAGRRVVDELNNLCARSLVLVDRSASAPRYMLLRTVRAFGAQELLAHEGRAVVGARLIQWFTGKAAAARDVVEGPDPAPGLRSLQRDAPNVRAAHRMCLELGQQRAAELLVSALGPLVMTASGALPDLRAWLAQIVPDDAHTRPDRLQVLLAAMWAQGRSAESSRAMAIEAERLARAEGDVRGEYFACARHAHTLLDEDLGAAERVIRGAMALPGPVPDVYEAWMLAMLNVILLRRGDHAASRELMNEVLASDTTRYGLGEPMLLFHAGRLALDTGDLQMAGQHFAAAERSATRTDSAHGLGYALFGLATLSRRSGDLEKARDLGLRVLQIDKLVDPREAWADHFALVRIYVELGDFDHAVRHVDALRRDPSHLAHAAHEAGLGYLHRARGDNDLASHHLRTAIDLWTAIPHVEFVADLIEQLSDCAAHSSGAQQLRRLAVDLRVGQVDVHDVRTSLDDLR